jgi:16S rRNA (cytidine1402-2'-O)-methyltransferase
MNGKLYLIPTPLGEEFLPDESSVQIAKVISTLNVFIVEELRTARRFLKKVYSAINIDTTTFYVLNEHTTAAEFETYLKISENGIDIGLITEAGCPAIADPGSQIVKIAHKKGIKVIPLVGPSSITLALMASGLNGQQFAFLGYLPIKPVERKAKIQQIEKRSKTENQTQIFIETPYRNISLFNELISTCNPETILCIASNITQSDEYIATLKIKEWKTKTPDIHKKPAVFLLLL